MIRKPVLSVLTVTVACCIASAAGAHVKSPWVTTDRTVDCSSYETIVKGVIKPGMTEEEKALAMYDFYRQMIYHYRNLPESRDPVKCINVIGNTLCGSQATCMKGLLEAAGIKARVVAGPGHTFYEAFYDGQWHGYDTFMNFYVFTRGDKPHVASFEEIKADNTLATKAVEEKRAVGGFLPCGDTPNCFMQGVKELGYKPQKLGWSVKDYALRLGEQIVRSWWPHGKPLPGTHRTQDLGPTHTCGSRDRKNPPELFKFFEPYGIPKYGKVSISYRHYFNGWMDYSPDLSQSELKKALSAGELIFPMQCPFYISDAKVSFEATCPAAGDSVELSAMVDKKWTPIITAKEKGKQEYRESISKVVVRAARGRHKYEVKFKVNGNAKLNNLHIKTVFTHNAMAAPHLMPGKNRITVAAEEAKGPLTLVYRYKEAPNWVNEKTIEKEITKLPFTFDVKLPQTEKLPQMQDLTLRSGKLSWEPPMKVRENKILFDFTKPAAMQGWRSDPDIELSHDGSGMVLEVAKKAKYPQASLDGLKEDWTEFQNVVIEMENLGSKAQMIVFRVRSNDSNNERTDVQQSIPKGKTVIRIPVAGLKKTKVNAITKVYLMTLNVPEEGCKVRAARIYLEPAQDL